MKKTKIAFLALAVAASTNAFSGQLGEPGFSGELSLLAGYGYSKSNFNTDTKNKSGQLNTEGESESSAIFAPLGQVRYTFGSDSSHQVFLGTSRDDIAVGDFVLEAGYKFGVGENSSIAISYLPSLAAETWKDPFVTGSRETTDVSSNAVRFKYDNILDSAFSSDIAYYTKEIDEEESGSGLNGGTAIKQLDRDGSGIYAKLSYSHLLNDYSAIEPSFTYKSFSADGKAMSNAMYGTELAYKMFVGRHALAASVNYSKTSYDGKNSAFNKTQEDSTYGAFVAYEYDKLMGWDNWAFNGIAGYEVTSSNIKFYNENELIMGFGASYKF